MRGRRKRALLGRSMTPNRRHGDAETVPNDLRRRGSRTPATRRTPPASGAAILVGVPSARLSRIEGAERSGGYGQVVAGAARGSSA